jgi:hypothetical protein
METSPCAAHPERHRAEAAEPRTAAHEQIGEVEPGPGLRLPGPRRHPAPLPPEEHVPAQAPAVVVADGVGPAVLEGPDREEPGRVEEGPGRPVGGLVSDRGRVEGVVPRLSAPEGDPFPPGPQAVPPPPHAPVRLRRRLLDVLPRRSGRGGRLSLRWSARHLGRRDGGRRSGRRRRFLLLGATILGGGCSEGDGRREEREGEHAPVQSTRRWWLFRPFLDMTSHSQPTPGTTPDRAWPGAPERDGGRLFPTIPLGDAGLAVGWRRRSIHGRSRRRPPCPGRSIRQAIMITSSTVSSRGPPSRRG